MTLPTSSRRMPATPSNGAMANFDGDDGNRLWRRRHWRLATIRPDPVANNSAGQKHDSSAGKQQFLSRAAHRWPVVRFALEWRHFV
jgi:hypothetical protein